MSQLLRDLSRQFFLDVTADGAVFIRERGLPLTAGALPVFTVDTHDQALMIQVRHCRRAKDGTGIYRLNERPEGLDALERITELFRVTYDARKVDEDDR